MAPVTYALRGAPQTVATADFNRDGIIDVAVPIRAMGITSVMLGTGGGTLSNIESSGTATPIGAAIGDLNRDGRTDIAITDADTNQVAVFIGDADGTVTELSQPADAGQAPAGIAIGDFNGDGILDLAVTNASYNGITGQSVSIVLGNGDGTYGSPIAYSVGTNPVAVVTTDVNGDGKLDLIVSNHDSNSVTTLLGNGDGTFRNPTTTATAPSPVSIVLADLNGDGKLDLVTANASGSVSVSLGTGTGAFGTSTDYICGNGPSAVAIGDVNLDGVLDVVVTNHDDDQVAVLLGNGDGTFQPPTVFAAGAGPNGLALADVNQDGRVDVIVSDDRSNSLAVLINATGAPAANTVAVQAGDNQATATNARFANALSVLVRDAGNAAIAGQVVTFTAPSIGASGTFSSGLSTVQVSTNGAGISTAPAFVSNGFGGTYNVTARVGGITTRFTLTNSVPTGAPVFTSVAPPNAKYGAAYSFAVSAAGDPTITYSMLDGALPPGLAINPITGVLSGVATQLGTFSGTLSAANASNVTATQSFAIVVAPGDQTITFDALSARTLADPPFPLYASSTSGLPISFTSMTPGVCAISNGNAVATTLIGTCTIRASQDGDAQFTAAAPVEQSFSVTQAPQAIAFPQPSDQSVVMPPFAINGSASSGLPVTFASLSSPICTISGSTVTLIAVGTCTIQATQNGNATFAAATPTTRSFAVIAVGIQYFYDAAGNLVRIQRN
jgi:hypothetical protein